MFFYFNIAQIHMPGRLRILNISEVANTFWIQFRYTIVQTEKSDLRLNTDMVSPFWILIVQEQVRKVFICTLLYNMIRHLQNSVCNCFELSIDARIQHQCSFLVCCKITELEGAVIFDTLYTDNVKVVEKIKLSTFNGARNAFYFI